MVCKACNVKMKVTDSRSTGTETYREYTCRDCGERITTIENIAPLHVVVPKLQELLDEVKEKGKKSKKVASAVDIRRSEIERLFKTDHGRHFADSFN